MECNHNWILEVNAGVMYGPEPLIDRFRDVCRECGKIKNVDIEELKKRNIDKMIIKEIESHIR